MYRISITRIVNNPNYDAKIEAEKLERHKRGWGNELFIPETYEEKALTVDLTEDEFKAIKKAVLEVM